MEPRAALLALGIVLVLVGFGVLLFGLRRRAREIDEAHSARPAAGTPAAAASPAERLRAALGRTRAAIAKAVSAAGRGELTDDGFSVLEEALLLADVGVQTTDHVLGCLKDRARTGAGDVPVPELLRRLLLDSFAKGEGPGTVAPQPDTPWVILVTGVNGVGKTTTIGKLAARYVTAGSRVLMIAGDTFRAAATEQLERWAERTGATLVAQREGADPAAVVVDGLRSARSRKSDVVIIDTAGRLHTKTNLMEELRKIRRVAARECPGAPHETLLVLDATTGQNGLQQAKLFREAVEVSGVVLTKMDGTARGGVALAVAVELGVPVRFIGIGEGASDLEPFDPRAFVDALLAPDQEGTATRQSSRARG
jgi:fused signal recognition particle receptor